MQVQGIRVTQSNGIVNKHNYKNSNARVGYSKSLSFQGGDIDGAFLAFLSIFCLVVGGYFSSCTTERRDRAAVSKFVESDKSQALVKSRLTPEAYLELKTTISNQKGRSVLTSLFWKDAADAINRTTGTLSAEHPTVLKVINRVMKVSQ